MNIIDAIERKEWKDIAKIYKISPSRISQIFLGKIWGWVLINEVKDE